MKTKVLFLLPYPLKQAPSQRFRVEAFFLTLDAAAIAYDTHEFLDKNAWAILYREGGQLRKVWAVLRGFISRLFTVLFRAYKYDYIFIHREAAPLGPPVFEWFLAKLLRKKIIFDFDDAIWIPNVSEGNRLVAAVKCFWKVKYLCRWSYRVAAGNSYLAAYAQQFNPSVTIVPTCVDTVRRYNRLKSQESKRPVIGWTGSHSTLIYLDLIYPVLKQLEQQYDFRFLVICNQPPNFSLSSMEYLPWKEATEIDDLLQINIGLMPLVQDAWSEGKCGFKIIQYLSLGIPAVASPVGVNKVVVAPDQNGYLCTSPDEWILALEKLITDPSLRTELGKNGRKKVQEMFSIQANDAAFVALFN